MARPAFVAPPGLARKAPRKGSETASPFGSPASSTWLKRMRASRSLGGGGGSRSLGPSDFGELARRTGATHAVVEGGLPFEEVHRDGPIAVVRLPEAM